MYLALSRGEHVGYRWLNGRPADLYRLEWLDHMFRAECWVPSQGSWAETRALDPYYMSRGDHDIVEISQEQAAELRTAQAQWLADHPVPPPDPG